MISLHLPRRSIFTVALFARQSPTDSEPSAMSLASTQTLLLASMRTLPVRHHATSRLPSERETKRTARLIARQMSVLDLIDVSKTRWAYNTERHSRCSPSAKHKSIFISETPVRSGESLTNTLCFIIIYVCISNVAAARLML